MQAPTEAAVARKSVATPTGGAAVPGRMPGKADSPSGRLNLGVVQHTAPGLPKGASQPRHRIILASFLAVVVIPVILWTCYLFGIAADRYHSEMAFSIRSEETTSAAAGLLGAITQISTGTASDADILNEYISSQAMIAAVNERVDLRTTFRKPQWDPVFALKADATIEELTDYWNRMVHVSFENHAGIIRVITEAFTPEDAQAINQAILAESDALVNHLSEQARQDAIRYASIDLSEAEANLRQQRAQLADFRAKYHIVDPAADVAGQMGLLNALEGELAQALVERDTLLSYVNEEDQRVVQSNRRIDAISRRIASERSNLGIGKSDVKIADVLGQYEELRTDLEFAAAAYTQTLTNLALARGEARRQARYLASHIKPTIAEESRYPKRWLQVLLSAAFLAMAWGVAMIFYYNIRDAR